MPSSSSRSTQAERELLRAYSRAHVRLWDAGIYRLVGGLATWFSKALDMLPADLDNHFDGNAGQWEARMIGRDGAGESMKAAADVIMDAATTMADKYGRKEEAKPLIWFAGEIYRAAEIVVQMRGHGLKRSVATYENLD